MNEILSKVKPTVIILSAMLLAIVIATLGVAAGVTEAILDSDFKQGVAWGTIITLFVSVIAMAVSGIVAVLTAPDAPAPSVPVDTHVELIKRAFPHDIPCYAPTPEGLAEVETKHP